MTSFAYAAHPARVVCGSGPLDQSPAQVHRLGRSRVMVVHDPATGTTARRPRFMIDAPGYRWLTYTFRIASA